MSMTDGLPRAPWRAPEAPRRTSSRIFVAVVVVTIALPVVALAGLFGWGFSTYASHDRPELIDNPPTIDALERPCGEMAAADLDLSGPPAAQAGSLLVFVAAGRGLPKAVDALDPGARENDVPTASWGDDWTALLDAVETYARTLGSTGAATFTMPLTEDGYSIVPRMDLAEPGGCAVPAVLAELDPSAPHP